MTTVWINGEKQTHVSVSDRAFTYGDGLFETIRVCSSKPELLEAHLSRLEQGLKRLKFPDETFEKVLEELSLLEFSGDQILKIIVSRGEGQRGYALPDTLSSTRVMQLTEASNDFSSQAETGVILRTCEYQLAINPALAGIKHLNRLEQVLARSEWQDRAIADGVVTDRDGYVVECTMSNIFWVKGQVVYTPALDRCGVEGVMRNCIISKLEADGFAVEQGYFHLTELKGSDEIFIANSLIQLWPVQRLDDLNFKVGQVTRRAQDLLLQESLH
jgi:4-amino-4-deoxychorismate lyase